jgi:thiol-disulfide isomerase/thioredoxin
MTNEIAIANGRSGLNSTHHKLHTLSLMILALALAGCMAKVAPAPATATAKAATAATPVAADPEIKLDRTDKVGFDAQLAMRAGKVILVDFWATWCPKCREDFPHTVELDRRHRADGLAVFSFSCDDSGKAEEVMIFLREQGATFKNLISVDGSGDKTFEDFEIEGGALPHYKLYDHQGKLRKTFSVDPEADRQFSLEDVDAAVKELLAESRTRAAADAPDKLDSPDSP